MTKSTQQSQFATTVARAIEELGVDKVATLFEVSPDTAKRWAAGVANPHPKVKTYVINTLSKFCD